MKLYESCFFIVSLELYFTVFDTVSYYLQYQIIIKSFYSLTWHHILLKLDKVKMND